MGKTLRIVLFTVSLLVFIYVLNTVSKKKMNIRYSIIWIIWSGAVLVISVFPEIIMKLTAILGIEIPTNAIFLIMIFLLYCMSFYVFLVISKYNVELTTLNYEIANLNKRLDELERRIK